MKSKGQEIILALDNIEHKERKNTNSKKSINCSRHQNKISLFSAVLTRKMKIKTIISQRLYPDCDNCILVYGLQSIPSQLGSCCWFMSVHNGRFIIVIWEALQIFVLHCPIRKTLTCYHFHFKYCMVDEDSKY